MVRSFLSLTLFIALSTTAIAQFVQVQNPKNDDLVEHIARLGDKPDNANANATLAKRPNIIFVLTDDQDAKFGSIDYMSNVQRHLVGQGVSVENHFVTVAQCCPSRTTLFRGQAAHNTNNTHVMSPGGAYSKFVASGENDNYLPHWLKKAGYSSAFMGKFLNEFTMSHYTTGPSGWDWTDVMIDPYVYEFNNVVMSTNGERPKFYANWHQADILRLKALDRVEYLAEQEQPFFLQLAPSIPHNRGQGEPTIPLMRHKYLFPDVTAPRTPNYNPPDELQRGKSSWVAEMPLMDANIQALTDASMRARVRGLQGVDEMVEDIIDLLDRKGVLDNTYIIYTSDNGYHLGQHRVPGGKGLPYVEDTNVPFVVRGPGIPTGKVSKIPSCHVDFVPTVLEMAGLPKAEWPEFLDGRSLLKELQDPDSVSSDDGINREVLNIEFWGSSNVPAGAWTKRQTRNTYKALRLISDEHAWLFTRWCTNNQTELYDTHNDPYELHNLARRPSKHHKHIISRLSSLLLVTKSCGQESCRKPWKVLADACNCTFNDLASALDHRYDDFFASLPSWGFQGCHGLQIVENEGPYFPPESISLGAAYRTDTSHFSYMLTNGTGVTSLGSHGGLEQRHASFADVMRDARPLSDAEIGLPVRRCGWPGYCRGFRPLSDNIVEGPWDVRGEAEYWDEEMTQHDLDKMLDPYP